MEGKFVGGYAEMIFIKTGGLCWLCPSLLPPSERCWSGRTPAKLTEHARQVLLLVKRWLHPSLDSRDSRQQFRSLALAAYGVALHVHDYAVTAGSGPVCTSAASRT